MTMRMNVIKNRLGLRSGALKADGAILDGNGQAAPAVDTAGKVLYVDRIHTQMGGEAAIYTVVVLPEDIARRLEGIHRKIREANPKDEFALDELFRGMEQCLGQGHHQMASFSAGPRRYRLGDVIEPPDVALTPVVRQ